MYGLIGYPLGHSFSAGFFNEKFQKENIPEHYSLFPIASIDELETLIESHPDLKGLNVTIPYKQQILSYLSSISEDAKAIGAVNVVKISHEDGKTCLHGYNSDAIGFRNSLLPLLKPDMKKALVLGTGGAAHAVCHVLSELGIHVTSVSRHKSPGAITYADITKEMLSENLLIVNTTPLGMWPHTDHCPDIPYHFLSDRHLCFDLIYNPGITKFMEESEKYGATVKNGLEMLHLQALGAWEIWNS